MKILKDNWIIFDDEVSLAKELSREILGIAKKSIKKNNHFSIVLTGGKSILNLYKILSVSDSDWSKWHIYLGDERFIFASHQDRNDRVINEMWLIMSSIPKKIFILFK
jgi:6-phosphogluconolactonase